MKVANNNKHNKYFTRLFNYQISIIKNSIMYPHDRQEVQSYQKFELMESVSFLMAEGGYILAAASKASHKSNLNVNCSPSA